MCRPPYGARPTWCTSCRSTAIHPIDSPAVTHDRSTKNATRSSLSNRGYVLAEVVHEHAISNNIRTLNQNQAISFVYSMDEFLSMFVWSHERFIAALFGVFSFVALGLATVGLASVVTYSVEQRTREFGIRTALGAPRWNVLVLSLTSTARTTGLGLLLGIILSISLNDAVHRWTQSSLRDPSVLAAIAAIFLFASAVA